MVGLVGEIEKGRKGIGTKSLYQRKRTHPSPYMRLLVIQGNE